MAGPALAGAGAAACDPILLEYTFKTMTKDRISWMAIGSKLGRVPNDCYNKYKSIQESQMKKGPFTAEELTASLVALQ